MYIQKCNLLKWRNKKDRNHKFQQQNFKRFIGRLLLNCICFAINHKKTHARFQSEILYNVIGSAIFSITLDISCRIWEIFFFFEFCWCFWVVNKFLETFIQNKQTFWYLICFFFEYFLDIDEISPWDCFNNWVKVQIQNVLIINNSQSSVIKTRKSFTIFGLVSKKTKLSFRSFYILKNGNHKKSYYVNLVVNMMSIFGLPLDYN